MNNPLTKCLTRVKVPGGTTGSGESSARILGLYSMHASPTPVVHVETVGALGSDHHLLAALQRRESAALSQLYDRYAPLVYTLARSSDFATAEAVTEGVFVDLWRSGLPPTPSGSLLATLIDLASTKVQRVVEEGQSAAAPGTTAAQFPALEPFLSLPPFVFEVMVLTYLGQLRVPDIAVALDVDQATILYNLATGLRLLKGSSATSTLR